jgi:NAD(P)-dependent dehydrogenase (short-subunit alcohol dehydrogenase family)
MTSKICLLTGATSGIGEAAAEALAQRGLSLILVGRSRPRCEATIERLRRTTNNRAISYFVADLSSQAHVRQLADQIRRRHPRLHVMINNAGGIFLNRELTVDGLERTLALNHLSYFLLTNLLLDVIKASAPARIINVSSVGHQMVRRVRFDDLQYRRGYGVGFRAYFQSKLANVMFTYELSRRLEGTGVTVNALNPGMVATNIGRNNGWRWRFFKPISDRIFRFKYVTPAQAATSLTFLATATELENVTGRYFDGTTAVASSRASLDEDAARRLWRISEEMTGLSSVPA